MNPRNLSPLKGRSLARSLYELVYMCVRACAQVRELSYIFRYRDAASTKREGRERGIERRTVCLCIFYVNA